MKPILHLTIALLAFLAGILSSEYLPFTPTLTGKPVTTTTAHSSCEIPTSRPAHPIPPKPTTNIEDNACYCETAEDCDHLSTSQPSYTPPITELFRQLLINSKYEEALTLYHTILSLPESQNIQALKAIYIAHVQELLKSPLKNAERITTATDVYLQDFYDDTDVRLLLVAYHFQHQQFYEALNTLQLANSYAFNPDDKEKVLKSYRAFVQELTKQLYASKQWDTLIDIYLFADSADLLLKEDQFTLIDIYFKTGDSNSAMGFAETLAEDPKWKDQVTTLLRSYGVNTTEQQPTPKSYSPNGSMVALIKQNNQFIVPVTLSNNETLLLLDTGASITTISRDHFESIQRSANLTFKSRQSFLTANGKTTGEIYTADTLVIGEHNLSNIDIAVLDYPTSKSTNGLLGMNVLQQFQFLVDQDKALIELIKK